MQASKEQLSRISRLGPQAAFDVLRRNKTARWVSEGLVVQALPRFQGKRPKSEAYGLCVSVSKKTANRAHDRNRMKRRLKAASSEIIPAYAKEGMDYMISGRFGTAERDFEQLKKDLLWCLKKLDLLK